MIAFSSSPAQASHLLPELPPSRQPAVKACLRRAARTGDGKAMALRKGILKHQPGTLSQLLVLPHMPYVTFGKSPTISPSVGWGNSIPLPPKGVILRTDKCKTSGSGSSCTLIERGEVVTAPFPPIKVCHLCKCERSQRKLLRTKADS